MGNKEEEMSDENKIFEKPVKIRRRLFSRINNLLELIYDMVSYYENEKFGCIDDRAKKIKYENLDINSIINRLALAETKVGIYEVHLNKLTKSFTEINILETTPSKAGRKRNDLAYSLAKEIYESHFDEKKKYLSAEKLSLQASHKLSEITGERFEDENGKRLLTASSARDYIKEFKESIVNN